MNNEKKLQKMFIIFTFIWSFIFWGLSIFLSLRNNIELLQNANLLNAILQGRLDEKLRIASTLSLLAGYGPLLGAVFILVFDPSSKKYFKNSFKLDTPLKYFLQIIALFLFITIIPSIALFFTKNLGVSPTWSMIIFFLLFFVYQFFTAATEEIGWRGFLLPSMLKDKTPWQASVNIGIIWALWHTPIVLYIFYSQGLSIPLILVSFIGFIAGTIAMSTVHTYYYLKTRNILFNMFIHALANTLPMFIGMIFSSSYVLSVAVQVLLWIFVIIITNTNKALFNQIQKISY